jgi:hypothetical protein
VLSPSKARGFFVVPTGVGDTAKFSQLDSVCPTVDSDDKVRRFFNLQEIAVPSRTRAPSKRNRKMV